MREERAEGGASSGRRGQPKPRRYTRRVMGLMSKLLHAGEGRKLKAVQSLVPEVAAYEAEMQARSDAELRAMTAEFRRRIDQIGPDPVADKDARLDALDDLLPEAFAVVREAGVRTLGQRHFDVQIMREERADELAQISGEKRDVAFGSQIRTYTLAPYRLVKDERTRYETGNVDAVLDGDLDSFIESFLQWRRRGADTN